jgi:hypothetical protein
MIITIIWPAWKREASDPTSIRRRVVPAKDIFLAILGCPICAVLPARLGEILADAKVCY